MACFILGQCVPGSMPGFGVGRRRDGRAPCRAEEDGETGSLNPAKGILSCA